MAALLTESGDYLTQEGGGHLLIDTPPPPNARVSQVGVEVLSLPQGQAARFSQLGVELLFPTTNPTGRISQVGLELALLNIYHIDVSPKNVETIVGRDVQYTAVAMNQLGQTRPANVTWACDPTVGTINAYGLFTPSQPGIHLITATEVGS